MTTPDGGAPADLVIRSTAVFTGPTDAPAPGCVVVRGKRIVAVGDLDPAPWTGPATELHDNGDGLVSAAFHDSHTFVTGTILDDLQVPVGSCPDTGELVRRLRRAAGALPAGTPVVGSGWDPRRHPTADLGAELATALPGRRVILWDDARSQVWQDQAARERYGLVSGQVSNEALAPVFADAAGNAARVRSLWSDMQRELFSRGVVSIKDIAFDDHPGVLPVLQEMRRDGALRLRVRFASQPVQRPYDLDFARRATAECTDDGLRFHGFKLMTDGVWVDTTADVLGGYAVEGATPPTVDYAALRAAAHDIHRAGFAVGLNVDGDAAARWAIGVIEELRRDSPGGSPLHSLSDVSLIAPEDLVRAGRLGLVLEVYPQFLLLFGDESEFPLPRLFGDRPPRLNDFAGMVRSGATVAAGTDLPLFLPSVPDSIWAATHRRFADGSPDGGWNAGGGMGVADVLRAWTSGGAVACGLADEVGTLTPGRRADVVAFDADLFRLGVDEVRDAAVRLTVAGGEVVHRA